MFAGGQDMPEGLSQFERVMYWRGYSRACKAFARKNGIPSIPGPVPNPGTRERDLFRLKLSTLTAQYAAERHPGAHKAGMNNLRRFQKRRGMAVTPLASRKQVAA